MSTLVHMETNDVEVLGSRVPDVTVILLITESTQSLRADHRALDSTLQSLHRWPLCVWASVYERDTKTRKHTGAYRSKLGADYRTQHEISTFILHRQLCMSLLA